jgi:hypothetical protein
MLSFLSKWLAFLLKKNHFLWVFCLFVKMVGYFAEKEQFDIKWIGLRLINDRDRMNRVLHHDNASCSPFDLGH